MSSEFKKTTIDHHFKDEQEALATGLTGWKELVVTGYGFEWSEEEAAHQFKQEYMHPQETKIVALSQKGKVVGTLVLAKGKLLQGIQTYGIHGIVVLPKYKGKGIGKMLYGEALKSGDVKIITGTTKTPAAVLARASGTRDHGMRTFYGYYEVTSNKRNGPTKDHKNFVQEYIVGKDIAHELDAVTIKDVDILLPNIPDLTNLPAYLDGAFSPVITTQIKLGNKKTAAMPLLSIHESVL